MQQWELRDFCFLDHQAFRPSEDVCPCREHASESAILLNDGPGESRIGRLLALGLSLGVRAGDKPGYWGENELSLQRAENTWAPGNWQRYNLQGLKLSSWLPRPRQAELTLNLSSLLSSLQCFMSLWGHVPDSQPLTRSRLVPRKLSPNCFCPLPFWP